jgi:hypothetical protein
VAIKTPKFVTLLKDGKFEIREYEEYISASVKIEADFKQALNEGFRILADYIFWNNRAKTKIEMTVPVTEQAVKSEKIEMTAPVTSEKVAEGSKYLISFSMPSKYTLATLPEPVNKNISINKVAPHKTAALKFSGYINDKTIAKRTFEMKEWLKKNNFPTKPEFILAQYNPPWIPGPFRHNEMIAQFS